MSANGTGARFRISRPISQLLFLSLVASGLLLVDLWAARQIIQHQPFLRLTRVKSLAGVEVQQPEAPVLFRERLSRETWVGDPSPRKRAMMALVWTRNQVNRIAADFPKDPSALLKHVEAGGGTVCSGMAVLYHHALAAVKVTSRLVTLQRNVFDMGDSHSTVEVLLDGRWVMFDPTFGISITSGDGRLLSAQEVHGALMMANGRGIRPVFYPPGLYPARLDTYYMGYLALYNNVFVLDPGTASPLGHVPVLGRYLTRRLYYEKAGSESVAHLEFTRKFLALAVIVFPAITLIVLAMLSVRGLQAVRRAHWMMRKDHPSSEAIDAPGHFTGRGVIYPGAVEPRKVGVDGR